MIRRRPPRPMRRWAVVIDGGDHVRRMITGVPLRVGAPALRAQLRMHGVAAGAGGDWSGHALLPEERRTPAMRRAIAGMDAPPIPRRAIAPERSAIVITVAMPADADAAACRASRMTALRLMASCTAARQAAPARQARHRRRCGPCCARAPGATPDPRAARGGRGGSHGAADRRRDPARH